MATSGGEPQRRKTTSHQGGLSGSRGGAQSVLVRPEKERWSSFPMGQRLVGLYKASSSSYLLQQIVHRYPESDPEQEESEGEEEGEEEERMDSEESSESELLNLEVCLPPRTPHHISLQPWDPAASAAAPHAPLFVLTTSGLPLFSPHFSYPIFSPTSY